MDPETAMEIVYDYFSVHGAGICATHQELHRISDEVMAATLNAYAEYMVVKALAQDTGVEAVGGGRLAASSEVEELWRTHLQCTEKYASFMESVNKVNPFVEFVHYDAQWSLEPTGSREMKLDATRKAYNKVFGKACPWLNDSEAPAYYVNFKKDRSSSFTMFESIKNKLRNHTKGVISLPQANVVNRNQARISSSSPTPNVSKSGSIKDLDIRVVSTSTNKTRYLTISPLDTVRTIKEMIQAQDGTPVEQQRLLYAGYELEDRRTPGDYGMQNGARIFC